MWDDNPEDLKLRLSQNCAVKVALLLCQGLQSTKATLSTMIIYSVDRPSSSSIPSTMCVSEI